MNTNRSAGLTLLACAVGLSLAACSSGGGSASPPTPAASNPAAPSSRPASSTSSGGTVNMGGAIGAFPIPPGAQVIVNVASGNGKEAELSSVTAAEAVSFYAAALPRAGYTITSNSLASVGSGLEGAIAFSGHGYKGTIVAASGLATPGAGISSGNLFVIQLAPQ